MTDFLNVSASLKQRRWVGPTGSDDRLAEAMVQETNLPLPLCRILVRREVAPSDAATYLNPTIKDLLPDHAFPQKICSLPRLVSLRPPRRVKRSPFSPITMSMAAPRRRCLLDWLRQMGRDATLYIPDRITEGYGPNVPAIGNVGA